MDVSAAGDVETLADELALLADELSGALYGSELDGVQVARLRERLPGLVDELKKALAVTGWREDAPPPPRAGVRRIGLFKSRQRGG